MTSKPTTLPVAQYDLPSLPFDIESDNSILAAASHIKHSTWNLLFPRSGISPFFQAVLGNDTRQLIDLVIHALNNDLEGEGNATLSKSNQRSYDAKQSKPQDPTTITDEAWSGTFSDYNFDNDLVQHEVRNTLAFSMTIRIWRMAPRRPEDETRVRRERDVKFPHETWSFSIPEGHFNHEWSFQQANDEVTCKDVIESIRLWVHWSQAWATEWETAAGTIPNCKFKVDREIGRWWSSSQKRDVGTGSFKSSFYAGDNEFTQVARY